MPDLERHRQFTLLAQSLLAIVERHYPIRDWDIYQHQRANAFSIYTNQIYEQGQKGRSIRPVEPHIRVEFSNNMELSVYVSDGVHTPALAGIADLAHLGPSALRAEFAVQEIGHILVRLIELGRYIYVAESVR